MGDGGSKTLRQLQAEEDEEERFQADLKQAVRQSLGTDNLFLRQISYFGLCDLSALFLNITLLN